MLNLGIRQSSKQFFKNLFLDKNQFGNETPLFYPIEFLQSEIAFSDGEHLDDLSIVKRIIDFYVRAAEIENNFGNSMWQAIFNHNHKEIHEVFIHQKLNAAAHILQNPRKSEILHGIDDLTESFQDFLARNKKKAKHHAALCLDGLIRFGEAIGALRVHNPEALSKNKHFEDANSLIDLIENTLGKTISFPNPYAQERGINTRRGIFSYRVPQALYQAWRIKNLLKDVKKPRVVEIGAGLGRTAYYARCFGIENYTIVDLPFTALSSGYFLARTLGENCITWSGENANNSIEAIKILTPNEFLSNKQEYDLIINVDSLTEMDRNYAATYLNKIYTCTKLFLSINHEANSFTAHELLKENSKAAYIERYPYWMRKGYLEEIVRFK